MKAVHLLVNSVLPPDLRNNDQTYDIKSLNKILHAVAFKHPDQFADVEKKISDIGRKASYYQGETITLNDLTAPFDRTPYFQEMEAAIKALPKNKDFESNRIAIMQKYNDLIEKANAKYSLEQRNNIAMSVLSGARGKGAQLKAMVATPGTFSDYKGRVVPVFSKESFAEGVRPAVFLASTNGARAAVVSSKSATAKGGDLAKQLASSAADLVVRKEDCGTENGIELSVDDKSMRGRVLAKDAYGIKAGTVIGRNELDKLKKAGADSVVVRSPQTCSVPNGLCAYCVGRFYNGSKMPKVGDTIGLLATSTVGEPLCLVKGTEVRMADGSVKKIEDIEPGEYVLGSDMNGYCKPTRVVNKFHNGPRNCYRSYIKKGYGSTSGYITLDSTAEHKILGTVRNRSIQLHSAELNISAIGTMPESKYTVRMCQSITGSEGGNVHEPMAMLLGMLVGDGSYKGTASGSAKNAVHLSCYDDEQTEALRKELEPLGLLVKSYTVPNEYRIIEADQYNTANWTSIPGITHSNSTKIRNRVRAKLIEEGMWGQDCYTKTLPKSIWSWDMDSVCRFVGGLIATDGYVTARGTIGYSSNNIELLKQIKALLQFRLGVYSTNITCRRKKKQDGTYYNPTYEFTINEATNVMHFAEMVKIPGRKAAILTAAARKSNYKRRGLYKLEKQEWLGVQDTWDLEVDNDTHLFALANGLIVSNTQMALCLYEHTLVRMADGSTKCIKDIVPGEYVLGSDVEANTFPVKVVNLYDQGLQEVQDYTFGKGQTKYRATITATKNHKVLLNKRTSSKYNKDKYGCSWGAEPYKLSVTRLADINKNTHAVYSKSVEGFDGVVVAPVLAYMVGMFIGDGIRYEKGSTPKVSCADNTLVDEVNNEAEAIGMKLIKRKRGHDWAFTRNTTIGNNPFSALLCELGLDSKYCYEKELPEAIWRWDDGALANLIAGYFDADGSIYKLSSGHYGINFTSTSKALIEQLKSILEFRFAIHSTPIHTESALRKGSNHLRSSININRADLVKRFADIIGKYSKGKKRIKLTELDFTGLQDRNPSGYTFGKFISVSASRLEHCFDIEVDHPDHLFVLANGLIVSNSAKHTAGMSAGKKSYSGLGTIIQFTQSPEAFKDRGAVSEIDGKVTSVEEAPQGGMFVTVEDKKHYVLPGHEVYVKPGDTVEAGDQLAEGLVDPEDIVRLKGLGEGQLYYAERLHQMLQDSGAGTDRRNTEVLARGAIRHIKVTNPDGLGSYLPDDVVDYNAAQKTYKVPDTAKEMSPKEAIGKYLQKPYLHYTIGTRVTPSVARKLAKNKYNSLLVDDSDPGFTPHMVRLRTASHTNPDWMASLATSSIAKQLNEGATRGDDTNIISNPDFRPRLAVGENFGKNVGVTGEF